MSLFLHTHFPSHDVWNQDYWGRPGILSKPIFGIKEIEYGYPGFVEFDCYPAQAPYDIGI